MFLANLRGSMNKMERWRREKMPAIDRSVVADIPLFSGLAPAELDELLREARSVRYAKDSAVFEQGAEAESFFVLLHGHLRVEKTTPQGHQIVVRYVSPREIFGVAQALALERYPATAMAAVDSIALCWPSAAWPRLTARFPTLAANALQTVGRRLQDTQARVLEMSSEQVEQRVAHALLRLAKQAGRRTEAGVEIDFPISRQDVAEMTGTIAGGHSLRTGRPPGRAGRQFGTDGGRGAAR
jgi:CRP/FNR family transcriptional regulator, nitrogen oxide reductase regulator